MCAAPADINTGLSSWRCDEREAEPEPECGLSNWILVNKKWRVGACVCALVCARPCLRAFQEGKI